MFKYFHQSLYIIHYILRNISLNTLLFCNIYWSHRFILLVHLNAIIRTWLACKIMLIKTTSTDLFHPFIWNVIFIFKALTATWKAAAWASNLNDTKKKWNMRKEKKHVKGLMFLISNIRKYYKFRMIRACKRYAMVWHNLTYKFCKQSSVNTNENLLLL